MGSKESQHKIQNVTFFYIIQTKCIQITECEGEVKKHIFLNFLNFAFQTLDVNSITVNLPKLTCYLDDGENDARQEDRSWWRIEPKK